MSFENKDFVPLSEKSTAKKGENKSRFSEKQVKFLENVFKVEWKIEPVKKVQLAKELGLEPKQVAIWFQNRRARWKSKQLEDEFRILKTNYENLATQIGSLKEENHSLQLQVQNLKLALQRHEIKMNSSKQELIVQDHPNLDELGDNSQASTDLEWCTTDATYMLNQSCCSAQLWDFWNCLE